VGNQAIPTGGGFIIPLHFYFAEKPIQADDPAAANYITIASSNSDVKFAHKMIPMTGIFADSLHAGRVAQRIMFRVTQGTLNTGDQVTFNYGDRSVGSPGIETIHWSNSAVRFPVWLLASEVGPLTTLPDPAFESQGGSATDVAGFSPSTVAVGEVFSVSVRTEDKYRNLATGGAPAYNVLLNGEFFGQVAASEDTISILKDLKLDRPGVYRLTFETLDGKVAGAANPILAQQNSEPLLL
jgi:hypothetical protein